MPSLGWARVIGGWYLAIAIFPLGTALWQARSLGAGTEFGCLLLGIPALGLVVAPRTFIRSTILVVGLLIGFSLPISLAIGPRWVAMAGFGLLLVPLVLLVGIRRRMLEAAFQSRLRERMDEMVHPVDPGQPVPPRTLREIP